MNESEVQKQRQVVLITGAACGIGRAIAERLADDGHHLALNDIDGGALTHAVAHIKECGHQALGLAGDVSDPDTTVAMVDKVIKQSCSLMKLNLSPARCSVQTAELICKKQL